MLLHTYYASCCECLKRFADSSSVCDLQSVSPPWMQSRRDPREAQQLQLQQQREAAMMQQQQQQQLAAQQQAAQQAYQQQQAQQHAAAAAQQAAAQQAAAQQAALRQQQQQQAVQQAAPKGDPFAASQGLPPAASPQQSSNPFHSTGLCRVSSSMGTSPCQLLYQCK